MAEPLHLFVHSASECLTDHLPHGDGLICHSLFRALLDRGHRIWATTKHNGVKDVHPNLTIVQTTPSAPAHSLHSFEYSLRIDRQLRKWVSSGVRFDLAWRLHPYGLSCPICPGVGNLPLAIGPIYYEWPDGRPPRSRFGISIRPLLAPLVRRGWSATLRRSALVLGSTHDHARKLRAEFSQTGRESPEVSDVPVIVSPPDSTAPDLRLQEMPPLRLAIVAGLRDNKRVLVICEAIGLLRKDGLDVRLTVCGDGPLRTKMEETASVGRWREALDMRGNIPNTEVYKVLADSHLLLSAAVGEPYGRNIVEAMSVGTPVVAHRSGGPAEIIAHDVDGWLVDESTPEAFAAAVSHATQLDRWHRLSHAAHAKAQQWRPEVIGKKLERLFLETVARHRQRGADSCVNRR